MLRSRSEVGKLGGEGRSVCRLHGGSTSRAQTCPLQDSGQTKSAESRSHLAKDFAPRELTLLNRGDRAPVGCFVFEESHRGEEEEFSERIGFLVEESQFL